MLSFLSTSACLCFRLIPFDFCRTLGFECGLLCSLLRLKRRLLCSFFFTSYPSRFPLSHAGCPCLDDRSALGATSDHGRIVRIDTQFEFSEQVTFGLGGYSVALAEIGSV